MVLCLQDRSQLHRVPLQPQLPAPWAVFHLGPAVSIIGRISQCLVMTVWSLPELNCYQGMNFLT